MPQRAEGGARRRRSAGLAARSLALALAAAVLAIRPAGAQVPPNAPSLVPDGQFRVCAGPTDMPFSNHKRQGFENKIAALVAHAMHRTLSYIWYPESVGFVRRTLLRYRCDVIAGVFQSSGETDNTDAYYHSAYLLVTRTDQHITADRLSSPVFRGKRIGVVAGTPPATLLAKFGLAGQVKSYHLQSDTRFFKPAKQMLFDLARGRIDVALDWGPIAAYYIRHDKLPLRWVVLRDNPAAGEPRLDFYVSMGVRPGEARWVYDLSKVIDAHQPEITRILRSYGVPLLDENGKLIAGGGDRTHKP